MAKKKAKPNAKNTPEDPDDNLIEKAKKGETPDERTCRMARNYANQKDEVIRIEQLIQKEKERCLKNGAGVDSPEISRLALLLGEACEKVVNTEHSYNLDPNRDPNRDPDEIANRTFLKPKLKQELSLDNIHLTILLCLSDGLKQSLDEISSKVISGPRTIYRRLKDLQTAGYVNKQFKKNGYTITTKGKKLLKSRTK